MGFKVIGAAVLMYETFFAYSQLLNFINEEEEDKGDASFLYVYHVLGIFAFV